MGKRMNVLLGRFNPRYRDGVTACGGDAPNWSSRRAGKEDGTFAIPRTTSSEWRTCQRLSRTAIDIDCFKLTIGKEPNRCAVGDQKGAEAPSVFGNGRATVESS